MDYKIRLGATLEFDSAKELDLIKNVKELTDKHKLGAYINCLLRYVWEHPEKFRDAPISPIRNGLDPKRDVYFKNVDKELIACKESVDNMYKEMLQLLTAAKVGSTFGLVENTSEFILGLQCIEEYIKKIRSKLNFGKWGEGVYESAKIQNAEEVANAASDILVKLLISKNVDMRINSAGGNVAPQPVNVGSNVQTSDIVIDKDAKEDKNKTNDSKDEVVKEEYMDLVAQFCGQ